MSGDCGTCRHWDRSGSHRRTLYANADADTDYGICQAIIYPESREAPTPLPLVLVMDAEQYDAAVYCRAEFGCVLHSPRVS